MWDLSSTKWHWGRFSQSTSVSPANSQSTNCSTITIIIIRAWYNRPIVAAVPSGLSLAPLIIIIIIIIIILIIIIIKHAAPIFRVEEEAKT
jgi:hypothetical protein